MNLFVRNLSALAVATALLATSSFADLLREGTSKEETSANAKVAFRVIGLMKTKSGAT